ncbi:DegT/DnrJ/EryC1/StrS aminotransferase [Desulfarculus baarsii DSM 2075]|uniref:DegT/DnrJ/EryC1/StrS aminotransferase n=1 Tax=Desulfarculus baarsii (strain ATCC 33931 / DSM 2075 / LMG 7858 / VKM B-1802 / 2st14) TaxID=644282 RepID=E1QEP5_DESB2|nr:DegT/DnrJ/EryC1/StrS family aminotransferase [Desulfarculus baarsii]ADK84031.1 DegT/DnrJ/EryC1/StrS aminotransferase [Desulfarculus baarsii DSM 2075]
MPGFEWLGREEKEAVVDVMDRGVLFRYEFAEKRGDAWRVRQFEEAFAAYAGAKHALAVTSGSAALKVALCALGVGPGDEVITQGFTFVATWEAILDCGAEPVFCEIDDTLCMDPADLEKKITPRTRCIVPVHMMGAPADIGRIKAVADAHGVPVLEDTAQAAGCFLNGRHMGTFGKVGTFSFDAVKTLTTGEGGMVITDDADLWRRASEYHDHGHDHRPVGRGNEGRNFFGFNFRMMELQGAIGLAQLAKMPAMVQTYQKHKNAMLEALGQVPGLSPRRVADRSGDAATFVSWFLPDAQAAARFNKSLADSGCGAVPWGVNTWHSYPNWEQLHAGATPIASGWPFKRPGGADLRFGPADLPNTKELLGRCLSWQIMLNWDDAKIEAMRQAVAKAAKEL